LNLLATACGFRIHTVLYECNVLPYAGSELYRRGLPLFREGSPGKCLINTEFSEQEFDEFKRLARQDHVPGWAGRACFLLTPSPATPESHAEMPDPLRCGCD